MLFWLDNIVAKIWFVVWNTKINLYKCLFFELNIKIKIKI